MVPKLGFEPRVAGLEEAALPDLATWSKKFGSCRDLCFSILFCNYASTKAIPSVIKDLLSQYFPAFLWAILILALWLSANFV